MEKKLKLYYLKKNLYNNLKTVIDYESTEKYRNANINRATNRTTQLQNRILENILDESIYGNSSKIENINAKVNQIVRDSLTREKRRVFRQESEYVDSIVEKNIDTYSRILTNRVQRETISLRKKIENEIESEKYKHLSGNALKKELIKKYEDTGKIRFYNIMQDATHGQTSNIQLIRAKNEGYNYKIWMNSSLKGKIRPWHVAENIIPVPIDEYFDLFGKYHAQAMFPGDLNAGAENVANCRCWLRYTKDKPEELKNRKHVFHIPSSSYLNQNRNNDSTKTSKTHETKKINSTNTTKIKTKIQNISNNLKSKIKTSYDKPEKIDINRKNKNDNARLNNRIKPLKNKINEIKHEIKLKRYFLKFGENIKVYKYKDLHIILKDNPQYIKIQEIERLYDSLPPLLKKYVNEIVIHNQELIVGNSEVLGFVTKRNRFCNILKSTSSLSEYKNTIVHELVHILDNNKGMRKYKISNSRKWKKACKEDEKHNYIFDKVTGKKISDNYVSTYSRNVYLDKRYPKKIKLAEDLAESIMRYLDPYDIEFAQQFPNRAEFIEELLGVKPNEI